MVKIETLIRKTQDSLFEYLSTLFSKTAEHAKGEYIFVPGEAPVLLVAHLDTVHTEPVKTICYSKNGNILMSPQGIGGDDRCGVYALLKIHSQAKHKPSLLFTCDEEIGGNGAAAFADDYEADVLDHSKELKNIKMIIEIDRKGSKDAVYYSCINKDFEKYINSKGFKTAQGSFSDISFIAPALGIAAVNISSGYHDAHTRYEHINLKELYRNITIITKIVEDSIKDSVPSFEYIEAPNMGFDRHIFSNNTKYPYCITGSNYYNSKYYQNGNYVPLYLEDEYNYLTEIYGKTEIDEYRKLYGDEIIHQLYDQEIAYEKEICNTQENPVDNPENNPL